MTDGTQSRTTRHLTLGPDLAEAARGRRFIAEIASEAGFSEERVFDITIACSEAIANAIEHSPKKGEVQVRVLLHVDRMEVQIEGPGEFQAPDSLKDRGNRGLGLPLMARLSDHLALFSGPRGQTFVSLTFYRPGIDRRGEGALPPSFVNLSQENRLLDDVLQHSPDGFCVLDDEWRLAYLNSALAVSLGCKADDLLGEVIWDVFPDLDPDARRALETGKAEHSGAEVVAVSGSGLWREWTAFPVEEGTAVYTRDVTQRKRAEEERERLRLRQEDLSASLTRAYEDLQEQTEELAAANEELRTQTEELWRQEEALRESEERSRFLLQVAEAVAEWTDLDKVLEASLRAIVDATAHSRASIGLWDPKRQEIRVAASSGAEPMALAAAPLQRFSSAIRAAIREGRTVTVDYDRLPPEERQIADAHGARNGLLVPLAYHEQVIGVVMVDDPGERLPFTRAEIELTEGIARQAAVALENARLYEAQKKIAGQLQQAIMEMPVAVEGLEISHLYRSATEEAIVGGDFYDVFDRADGSIILLVGDVSGHGVNSAKVATMVKASLVALAQGGGEPAEVLAGVNKLLVHKRVPGFTSVLYAVYDPVSSTLRYCSAGHPNLLIGHADRTVEFVGGNHAPLGVFPTWSCVVDGVTVQPGETLLFYTDGLTEARHGREIFGEERLAQAFAHGLGLELDDLPRMLLDEALAFSDGRLQDDLAILAVRRPSAG